MENLEKKDEQLRNLENLIENHTRTERHLEQYSEIGEKANKENARNIQKIREEEIKKLENKIKEEDKYITPEEHLENLKEKDNNTANYVENNKDHMDNQIYKNLQEKQQRREEQIDFLQNENKKIK